MADPLTTITGLSSGIDSKALVEQIMLLERRPAARLETQIGLNKKKSDAFDQLRKLLDALRTAAEGFKTGSGLSAFTTSASGADSAGRSLLAATAGTGAAPGTHQIEVKSLARAQKTIGAAQAAGAATALGLTGTFAMSVGGTEVGQVTVEATDTLLQVRDKINALGGVAPKVQATVLTAGATDARLSLSGLQMGSAGAFTFSDVSGTLTSALGLNNAPLQGASDATFVVDGVPMTRTSNTVADAIADVTLTLTAAEEGKLATVTVERLPSAGVDSAKAFVEAYNKVVTFIQAQNLAAADGSSPPLRGDGLLRSIRGALTQTVIGTAVAPAATDLARLATAGISLQKDGTLSLDANAFKATYATRRDDLVKLFADRGTALFDQVDALTKSGTGTIDQRTAGLTERNQVMTGRVADIDSRLDKKRTALLAQYAKFEASLGRLKSLGDSLSSQLAGLNKSNND
ncbi:flagellar filament capping protein FliD [Roseisolibacter sp. H3M3-2]|uniref:flagellar filament capping protein FliD n=1 Tax=Roseisolibacter sp. H3M3-2 TaxID=3031323 RepID=UPI0023DB3B5F|nr:flagellar filament capping protein FliD [Roseisolibacter sp. H3M3-2]MDF1503724.1 flagellar filament capping protein FliD [Roseisolibacter sp. H3M3-2]